MEKEEVRWVCFECQSHWRKAGAQGDDGFFLAELSRWSISWKRWSVHFFLLGPVVDSFLLTALPLRCVSGNIPIINVEWYLPRTPLSGLSTPS